MTEALESTPPAAASVDNAPAPKASGVPYRPLGNRVLIRPIQPDDKTAGGILLPQAAKDKPKTGEVLAVGPGSTSGTGALLPMTVRVGDEVLFSPYAGTEIKHWGEELKLIAESDLLAVVS